ncbi:hypothetical protein ACFX2I_013321 [Malus domestica]
MQGGSARFDGYGRPGVPFGIRPPGNGIVPYGSSSNVAAGVGAIWGAAYDPSLDAADCSSEIELKTAPADFRFPTTNQTRHCFTRYIEFHRCVAARGEESNECEKFAKYYRSLCPSEWIEKWEEQRAEGTFPGPL